LFDTVAGLRNDILGHGCNSHLCGNTIALQGSQVAFCSRQLADDAALHSVNVAVVTIQKNIFQLHQQRVCSLWGEIND